MKKFSGILSFFIGLGLLVCFIAGFVTKLPSEVPASARIVYKILTGINYFILYLPSFVVTGFVVSGSVYFGRNPEGSPNRFSSAMLDRFKTVMIISLITAALLTLAAEVGGLLVNQKMISIVNQPKLIRDYVKVGNTLYDNGYYERAGRYADAALKLDPNTSEALALKDKSEVEINRAKTSDLRFKLYQSVEEAEKVDRVVIDGKQINEVYQYYQKALESYEKKEWFNAHYFAEMGLKLATAKDPNLEDLRKLSTQAWNNLTEYHNMEKSEDQKAFDKKYEGYLALVEKDDLKAYYIFRQLYQSSREFQSDPDVTFYLEVAENRINERSFFIDETLELESFESANDVYFSYSYKDGSEDIIYVKGITNVEETGNSIQYLRDLTVLSFDSDGNFYRKMNVPYAKMLPVSVKSLNSTTKSLMGIDDKIEYLPYIILRSVSRDTEGLVNLPEYTYSDGRKTSSPEYLIVAIPYSDFIMLENSTNSPKTLPLVSLFHLVYRAAKYGYCSEVYGQVLMNRLFYPLWIIIIMVLLAGFAWNNRIGINQYFKFTWILAFLPFLIIAYAFCKIATFLFQLINYVLLGGLGITKGLTLGLLFYFILLILDSIYFLSRRSKS